MAIHMYTNASSPQGAYNLKSLLDVLRPLKGAKIPQQQECGRKQVSMSETHASLLELIAIKPQYLGCVIWFPPEDPSLTPCEGHETLDKAHLGSPSHKAQWALLLIVSRSQPISTR